MICVFVILVARLCSFGFFPFFLGAACAGKSSEIVAWRPAFSSARLKSASAGFLISSHSLTNSEDRSKA